MMVYTCLAMQSDVESQLGDLEAQLACKEKEWKELQAVRVHQLESSLRKAEEECSSLRERYQQIKEDFQFNLAVLDERDRELERYDVVTAGALHVENKRQEEVKQLRLQVTRLEEQRGSEAERWREELRQSEHSAAQFRLQLEQLKLSTAGEIQKQMEANERMKLDFQCRIREVEGELTLQRQEMTAAFSSQLNEQEHQFNIKMDEMRAVVLGHDIKVKMLSKEVEVHSRARLQATETLRSTQEFCQQIQTQLQHKEQEIKDLMAVKDNRMKEVEEELKCVETKRKKEEDEHMKRYEGAIRALKECRAQLEVQRQAHTEQLQTAEELIIKQQEDVKVQASQAHIVQRDQQEVVKQKDETICRLHTEMEKIRAGWDDYVGQVSREIVLKDTEMIALQERESKLKAELERSRTEMKGYQQQLSAGLQREQILEQRRVQADLEGQRRCEDVKAELYLANEQLIRGLTQTRDQAEAELREKEKELQDLTVLLRSVKTERDQAVQGLAPRVDYLASEEICRLQEQNGVLRAVVNQMRKDMEGLSRLPPQTQTPSSPPRPLHHPAAQTQSPNTSPKVRPAAADYTEALEQEVSLLKARCRKLKEQLEGATGPLSVAPETDEPAEELPPEVPDNTHTKLQRLEQGRRRPEKCANTSSLQTQEVKASHGESALTSVLEQVLKEVRDPVRSIQAALVRRLQEENLRLRRQQASALTSAAVFDQSDCALLRSRLKRAALCISRLSVEKQQLIKMGNRLRAQVTAAEPQEAAEQQRDSTSADTRGEQHGRLSALEQLQYQLTTQELQYALRQRTSMSAEQPAAEEAANTWIQGTLDRPEPLPGVSRSLLSSEESLRSLKELWEKLDHGLSPSLFSEGELSRTEAAESGGAGVQMMMQGIGAPIHNHPMTEGKQGRPLSTAQSKTNKTRQRPGGVGKIRNYNLKD